MNWVMWSYGGLAALVFAVSSLFPKLRKPMFIGFCGCLVAFMAAGLAMLFRMMVPASLPDFDLKDSSRLLPIMEKGTVTDGIYPPFFDRLASFKRMDPVTEEKVEHILGSKGLFCAKESKAGKTVYLIGHLQPFDAPYLVHGLDDSLSRKGHGIRLLENGWEELRISR